MQLPLNVSPVSASFIGLMRPGIHLVLSFACDAPSSSRKRVATAASVFTLSSCLPGLPLLLFSVALSNN